ncbi:hypothetical protein XBP1_1450020 [Xenorhabdus bovienii str. puntauvense]|uniref:Uncharacterized protein n=2 Tax=Xenorhabdus bovienii TaxID=40576 RepID=A0A077NBL0_XENBV|nr:hypothetical protein XBFFR1_1990017 [Xenorhabdus bovienii str. feltiae France]CDG91552.1 hypothetical protein XBFFL1_1640064 [Xenorhabdus bovienii str. feltiae Florida]CDG95617.1 hypothetical protein XBP1_1450020 [Xenorhabdus bovienii str. puntauvense]CDH00380.1 hypothetical protein XBFM1_160002 [Xenorhabdus bovienii str. feltiae Moldova]
MQINTLYATLKDIHIIRLLDTNVAYIEIAIILIHVPHKIEQVAHSYELKAKIGLRTTW